MFLPGESQGRRSLVGCHLWGHTELDTTDVTAAAATYLHSTFTLETLPSKWKLHQKLETFQWTLYQAVDSLISPSWPLLSPSFQFSGFGWRDTILYSSSISYDINLHTFTAEYLCPCSCTEANTQLCVPRDLSPECLLTARKTIRQGKLCRSSQTSSLQIHHPCQILSLFLKIYLISCHLPP